MRLESVAALRTLPPRTRVVMAANLVSSVGTGLVQPFLVLYLTRVRGLPVGTATAVISVIAVASLVGGPVAGRLADGFGIRLTAAAAMTTAAVGTTGFALVTEVSGAVLAGLSYGLAYGAMLSVWNVVIARSTQGESRSAAFGLQFVALNVGVGLGGVLGGIFASTADPGRFQLLYVCDGLSFLVAGALLVLALGGRRAPLPSDHDTVPEAGTGARGYGVVLRDRALLKVLALTVALMVVGYGQLESSIPGLVAVQGMDARLMAWAFVANTCCIVLIQAVAVTRISRTPPAALLAATATSWAGCWLLLLLAAAGAGTAVEAALVIGALAVFAVGEALLAVALPTLVNSLAPEVFRGRYNGAYSAAMSTGLVIGPLLGGALLGAEQTWLLPVVLGLGCVMCAGCAVLLGRRSPRARAAAQPAPEVYDTGSHEVPCRVEQLEGGEVR
ncbi:MFS transporter [Streptomyces yunnanensis]|uniref:Predicted arabinose efflux permease, MFS family n=1 Tax=Streptomyces yunnanensis TaxID=156453 RepID=A0A9X8MPY0_9ACTN|nr:MFS transporter [Streptomyces yunnanensis]SHL38780.1 Predicted arabinose efflux permease, MFS family [Streptomyces yunnanensis]